MLANAPSFYRRQKRSDIASFFGVVVARCQRISKIGYKSKCLRWIQDERAWLRPGARPGGRGKTLPFEDLSVPLLRFSE